MLSVGVYPGTGLKQARELRDEARRLLTQGVDPGEQRKAEKATASGADTFEAIAREWWERSRCGWTEGHSKLVIRRLEENIFPWIGSRPVGEVSAPEILACLRRMEERGIGITTRKTRQYCSMIARYAIATGRAERDASADLRGALAAVTSGHRATITAPGEVGALLRAIDGYLGAFATCCALKLAPILFVRPGELRRAEWAEIDLDRAEWRIPAAKMKQRAPHTVPLPAQAVAILRELFPCTGTGKYLFPGARTADRPMSENTVNTALRRLGYEKSGSSAQFVG
jgi:integrase